MPSGVEHRELLGGGRSGGYVRIPLMPSGVEHGMVVASVFGLARVRIPLMPSGVEHQKQQSRTAVVWM